MWSPDHNFAFNKKYFQNLQIALYIYIKYYKILKLNFKIIETYC